MYSIDLVGSNIVIKNTSNPRVNNQFVVATVSQSSNDLTWAFSEDDRRVKLIANGITLTPALFSQVKVSGIPCTDKADFISKMAVLSDFAGPVSAPSPYKVYTALLTQSGGDNLQYIFYDDNPAPTLTIGVTYYIDTGNLADFTNVGAPNNNDGTYFVATGTTPNSWGEATLTFNTGAPVVTVLENTIGNIWFTYNDTGNYSVVSTDLFTNNKSWVNSVIVLGTGGPANRGVMFLNDSSTIGIQTETDVDTPSNDILQNTPIEIRVYN